MTANNEIQKTTETSIAAAPKKDTVQQALEKMKGQFQMVLPKHLTPERLCRVALNACHATPKLLDCDRKSLFSAIMRSAQLGLEPDGVLGQAYLIPFKRNFKDAGGNWQSVMEVQFIAGYKGLIDLARRSGDVTNIIAKEVYQNDEFSIDWAQEMPFTHKPKMTGDRGEITHFWAMARFKDGGFHWDYLTREEVEAIRDKGNGGKNAVWKDHFVEMGKKTAIRRIAKYLPMSVQRAAATEDLMEAGKSFHQDNYGELIIDGDSEVVQNDSVIEQKGNEGVKQALKEKHAKEVGADPETGEIIDDDSAVPKALRKEAKKKSIKSEEHETSINVSAIPLRPLDSDATKTDFNAWKEEFAKRCAISGTKKQVSDLYQNNVKILNQIESASPEAYTLCEQAYSDAVERLDAKDAD